jgi:hypothetical protein
VKFKVGFTIGSETLFAMIAKMLPIEDVSVEEIAPSKTPQADRAILLHQKKFAPRKKKRDRGGPRLNMGINAIILAELKEGPKREIEMRPKIKAAGFSENSTSSRLEALRGHGVVTRVGDGRWKLNAT